MVMELQSFYFLKKYIYVYMHIIITYLFWNAAWKKNTLFLQPVTISNNAYD